MPETPIITTGEVLAIISDRLSLIKLKNGKEVTGFPSREFTDSGKQPKPGDIVTLEMTPFDFSKARIAGINEKPE